LPEDSESFEGFYEKLYSSNATAGIAFIRQDFLQYYRHTQKWVDLFEHQPMMKDIESAHI
jgi:DNA phosphorothioation-dependent restriction protein DptG